MYSTHLVLHNGKVCGLGRQIEQRTFKAGAAEAEKHWISSPNYFNMRSSPLQTNCFSNSTCLICAVICNLWYFLTQKCFITATEGIILTKMSDSTEQNESGCDWRMETDSLQHRETESVQLNEYQFNALNVCCSTQSCIHNSCFVPVPHICKQGHVPAVWAAPAVQKSDFSHLKMKYFIQQPLNPRGAAELRNNHPKKMRSQKNIMLLFVLHPKCLWLSGYQC